MPEPEDSAAEPSDELTDDFSGSDDDTGRHFVSGPDTVGYPPQRPFARYADAARDDYLEDFTDDVFDDVIEHGEPGGSYADEAGGDYPDSSRAGRSAVATPRPPAAVTAASGAADTAARADAVASASAWSRPWWRSWSW